MQKLELKISNLFGSGISRDTTFTVLLLNHFYKYMILYNVHMQYAPIVYLVCKNVYN